MPGQLRTIPLSIAAVGNTVDGREIEEKDVNDIVETYNPTMYGARINIDHYMDMSGWKAEALSALKLNGGMLGDVLELKTDTNKDGVQVLNAVLAPNASFVQLNQADQHVYFSIEIDRNFMGTGKTYLTGLAVTDYPASAYTSRANFSKEHGTENKDVSYLRADLLLDNKEDRPPKQPFYKTLFNKDDTMALSEQDKSDIGKAVADALTPAFTQLSTSINEFSKQNQQEAGGQQDEGQGGAQNKELTEQLTQLNDKFSKLENKFNELSNQEADDTTEADDEPTGDDGKYSNLL